jgi:hypothetical protein
MKKLVLLMLMLGVCSVAVADTNTEANSTDWKTSDSCINDFLNANGDHEHAVVENDEKVGVGLDLRYWLNPSMYIANETRLDINDMWELDEMDDWDEIEEWSNYTVFGWEFGNK